MLTGPSQENQVGLWLTWRRALLDFLFPPRCVGCLDRGEWLCSACRDRLPRLPVDRCIWCGRAVRSGAPHAGSGATAPPPRARPLRPRRGLRRGRWRALVSSCPECRLGQQPLDGLWSEYAFEGVIRDAVHRLKYAGRGISPGPWATSWRTPSRRSRPSADAIVAVPLHPSRLAERGFNQSDLLARRLAERTGLPLLDGPLRRVRPTEPQMALHASRRHTNVEGAFAVQGGRRGRTATPPHRRRLHDRRARSTRAPAR